MDSKKLLYISKYTNLWKTKKAFDFFLEWNGDEILENRYDILKYYQPKSGKPIAKLNRRELAHRVFSEYVRLYYCDDNGVVECISCNSKMKWDVSQAGHFITRANSKYTFDIGNVYPQCYRCNVVLSGNYIPYTLKMIDKIGKQKVEDMKNDKELVDITQQRYEVNIYKRYEYIKYKKNLLNKKKGNKKSTKNYELLEF